MINAISTVLPAFDDLVGLRQRQGVYGSPLFLVCLAGGAAFWAVLPIFVPTEPLPWHRIASMAFLSVAVWQPIAEELMFRGVLQGFLSVPKWGQHSFIGISVANGLTSILFSGAHVMAHSPVWAVSIFFPSLLFGILRDRSGSVFPPTALHIIYNAGYFFLAGGSSLV